MLTFRYSRLKWKEHFSLTALLNDFSFGGEIIVNNVWAESVSRYKEITTFSMWILKVDPYWTPGVAGKSYEFSAVRPSVHL